MKGQIPALRSSGISIGYQRGQTYLTLAKIPESNIALKLAFKFLSKFSQYELNFCQYELNLPFNPGNFQFIPGK